MFGLKRRLSTPASLAQILQPARARQHPGRSHTRRPYSYYGTWFNFGAVPSLAGSGAEWKYHTGFWAGEGLSGENQKTGERIHLSLEIPFASWMVRNAVQLDGDLVLFQLGNDQICLLRPGEKRIALIARGKGPPVAKP